MKQVLKALLVDDEEVANVLLSSLLKDSREVEVVGTATSIAEATRFAARHRPDLIFLDVQLGRESGFDLLAQLSYAPEVIFVTSHARHAVRAFEIAAVDYLMKPVTAERLGMALARLRARETADLRVPARPVGNDDVVVQREAGRLHVIPVGKIAAITSEGNFTRVYLRSGDNLFLRRMIGEWEAMLPPKTFLRVDRTVLLNLVHVREMVSPSRDLSVVLMEGLEEKFVLGRAGSTRLRAALRRLS